MSQITNQKNEMSDNNGDGDGEDLDEIFDVYESFEDLELNDNLLRGIYAIGYEKPSAIQQKGIKPFLDGHDIIAQSQSGTGKTATFSISLLQKIDPVKGTQGIIIAHTRELANQIYSVVNSLGTYLKYNLVLLTGGTSINNNIEELRREPEIIISTPGRLLDMFNKRRINYDNIKYIIIDEADELLSSGFINQIYDIFRYLKYNKLQVALYSATMPREFFDVTKKMMNKPKKILVKTEELTLEGIKQFYVNVERNEFKFDILCDIYDVISVSQSIIYCNSKRMVDDMFYKLNKRNFTISAIHSEMSQEERTRVIENFRKGETRILLSTDLLCRGIDVQQVSVVINYDIPNSVDSYIHRIGRSGRFGRKGVAINFVTYTDISKLHDIEKYYSTQIEEMPSDFMNFIK